MGNTWKGDFILSQKWGLSRIRLLYKLDGKYQKWYSGMMGSSYRTSDKFMDSKTLITRHTCATAWQCLTCFYSRRYVKATNQYYCSSRNCNRVLSWKKVVSVAIRNSPMSYQNSRQWRVIWKNLKRSQDLRILFFNPLDHFIMICEDGSLKSEPLYAFTGLSVGEVPLYCGIIPGKYNSPKTFILSCSSRYSPSAFSNTSSFTNSKRQRRERYKNELIDRNHLVGTWSSEYIGVE